MDKTGTRTAGGAMVLAAAAALLAMSHHPTHLHEGELNKGVHGVLIALSMMIFYGFLHWSRMRRLDRPAVALALIAYSVGMFGGIGAAVVDGFVVVELAPGEGMAGEGFVLARALNQALAYLGAIAVGAAYALWGVDLLRPGGGRMEKLAGAAGLAAGLVPLGLLAAGLLRMNMSGALIVYAVQWGWMALVGLLMLSQARRAAG
jgi:hypothetical protein